MPGPELHVEQLAYGTAHGAFLSHRGTPSSSILVVFSIIYHPAIGVPP